MTDAPARRWDAATISAMLAARIDVLVPEILPGARRQGHEWVVGSVAGEPGGSMSIHASGGDKAGVWADFSTGETGDALDLVAAVLTRGDSKQAFKWALGWLGLSTCGTVRVQRAEVIPKTVRPVTDEDTRRKAQAMWLAGEPVFGTPAEAYFRARGINLGSFPRPPSALRFLRELWCQEVSAKLPAIVAAITDGAGMHVATHRTWLSQQNGVWAKAPLRTPKKVLGQMRGGSIRLTRGASGKPLAEMPENEAVAIGEGIETCLSVAMVCPAFRVIAAVALSNMASVQLPPQCRRVLILADNDTALPAQRGLQHAVNTHIAAGREVNIARSPIGKDFNDAIR